MASSSQGQGPPEQEQRTPTASDECNEERPTREYASIFEDIPEPPRGVICTLFGRELVRVDSDSASARPTKSDNVCSLCAYILQNKEYLRGQMTEDEREAYSFSVLTGFVDLEASAIAGCVLCILLRDKVWESVGPKLEERPELRRGVWIENQTSKDFDYMYRYVHVDRELRREEDLFSMEEDIATNFVIEEICASSARGKDTGRGLDAAQAAEASAERSSLESTNSSATWTKIQSWLRVCIEEHTYCNLPILHERISGPEHSSASNHQWLPTRLLDCASEENSVRVVVTGADRTAGDYITLSHRWPESMPSDVILTTASFEVFRSGVALERLPQAVRDAITIARKLAVRYLWVDALCIVQDQKSDWEQESALMHKVYSNSYLNISALAARDTFDTLFRRRDVNLAKPAWIDCEVDGEMKRFHFQQSHHWQDRVDSNHLNLRAWVLQERLLAPRVVHFGEDEVFWECQEMRACDSQPWGHRAEGWRKRLATQISGTTGQPGLPRDKQVTYSAWEDVVKAYSNCKMSKGEDKLVAISGIAQLTNSCGLDDEYIAGMWRKNLQAEILWYIAPKRDETIQRRSAEYRAPSFSWASMTCSVWRHDSEHASEYLFDIVDVVVKHLTADKTGAICDAQMTVACRLQKLHLYGEVGTLRMSLVTEDPQVKERPVDFFFLWLDEALEVWDPRGMDGLYCFPAGIGRQLAHVLLRLVDIDTATYGRIGIAKFYIRSQEQLDYWSSSQTTQATHPCVSYQDGKHKIRLI